MNQSFAPWTKEQVDALNRRQQRDDLHAYTCGEHSNTPLVATVHGWICIYCDYSQTWAHLEDTRP
jgi:hypothetical protein